MNNIATSVEQSKRLIELGIDPNTASMSYLANAFVGNEDDYRYCIPYKEAHTSVLYNQKYKLPAWTLNDLISILPKKIPVYGVMYYLLEITKREIRYVRRIGGIKGYIRCAIIGEDSNFTLIDIAVKAIVKLKKEGVI